MELYTSLSKAYILKEHIKVIWEVTSALGDQSSVENLDRGFREYGDLGYGQVLHTT